MTHPLDGAFAKLDRAEEHHRCLDKSVSGWTSQVRHTFTGEKDDEGTEFRFYVEYDRPPEPVRWALLAGDCVHNLRSALNHVVYECSGPTPPDRCEFPIFTDPTYYDLPVKDPRGFAIRTSGITNPAVLAIIKGAQPWNRPQRPQDDHLWFIHELDNQDKHRLLIPVNPYPLEFTTEAVITFKQPVGPDAGPPDTIVNFPISMENHALLLTVRPPEPAERVKVDIRLRLGVGIVVGDSEPGGIIGTLGELCKYTRALVEEIRDALL